jgi:hypothetical protein
MTNRESLSLAAFERTLAVLDQNLPLIEGIPAIMEVKGTLATAINNIRLINVEVEKGVGGSYINFKEAKNNLIKATFAVQGALIAYATMQNNNDLLQMADIGLSLLKRTGNEALYDKCKLIHDLALPFKVVLASDYQLNESRFVQLVTALENYRLALPKKDLVKKGSVANTKRRNEAFEQTSDIMAKLGNVLLMLRSIQPQFYESYLAAAHIGGYRSKKAKNQTLVTGQVVDFETHAAIAGAKISVVLQQAETYSSNDGNFTLEIPTPGEFTIKAEKAGYTLWEDDIIIEAGESFMALVEMEKGE